MTGDVGTGKTSAALLLLDHTHQPNLYWTAGQFHQDLLSSQNGLLRTVGIDGSYWYPSYGQVWDMISRSSLVVLDELGTRATITDAAYDHVKRLIDDRYRKPLVVISNLELEVLARPTMYGDRVADRLAEGTVINVRGDSLRTARPSSTSG